MEKAFIVAYDNNCKDLPAVSILDKSTYQVIHYYNDAAEKVFDILIGVGVEGIRPTTLMSFDLGREITYDTKEES